MEQDPFSSLVFVFRGRRGDLIKVIWFDGDGLYLFAKRLERGRFIWPKAESGTVALTIFLGPGVGKTHLSMALAELDPGGFWGVLHHRA